MNKVFISQPMDGKDQKQLSATVRHALSVVRYITHEDAEEVAMIPRYYKKDESPLLQLADRIKMMASADIVVFCIGWFEDKRCRIEYDIAEKYGLHVIIEQEVKNNARDS